MEIRRTSEFDRRLKRLTDAVAQARIALAVQRMEDGNLGDSKSVGGGVIEARIHYGPGYRVYYTRRGAEIIVLLLCGDKSSQPTDIKHAREMAKNI
ncbi:type II toxin-antitoxin system RelE/ParE family toxin [Lysobacter sp. CFH 32150]|uniref:type II toxin-antitoxin system RelE/ParE family toxin n=1 Tax=Lysobacter sp. CFH 32150 TaxID=2927128 RepID=UPI001FA77B31|nr:type II toxin-antitoxin system RelE/ParE family toxin [Lysobacter sp. CFH 32150]MCI4568530.1 type II toxin-antitoxin system RelE/ParE family toxin [Lysobacter sp. CFH 32150]